MNWLKEHIEMAVAIGAALVLLMSHLKKALDAIGDILTASPIIVAFVSVAIPPDVNDGIPVVTTYRRARFTKSPTVFWVCSDLKVCYRKADFIVADVIVDSKFLKPDDPLLRRFRGQHE